MHRVKCSAGVILALTLGAVTATATRAQTLDCGNQDACVAFAATTVTASAPGDVEVIRIYYGLKSGSWTNLRITLDVPEYFLGSELLNDPLFNESCELQATPGDSWNIICDWVSASNPWVLSGANTYVGELYLTVVSRPFQTPADYDAVFNVSLSGENNGESVSDAATHVMTVNGDARLIPYNTSGTAGVITRTIDDEPVLGRLFLYYFRAQNNLGTPTSPIPGSNALDDVSIELELPPYMLLHAVDQEFPNLWSWPTDQIGTFGADITLSLTHPLGRSGEALDWDRASNANARGYASNWVRVFVFIPCQADAERGWPGLPVSDDEEPARVRYQADEVIHIDGDPPTTATEPHWWPGTGSGYTAGDFYVGNNPPAGSAWILNPTHNAAGCAPSLPTSSKDDSFSTSPASVSNYPNSRDVNNIAVSYLVPTLITELGPALVVDMVPPFHRVVDPVETRIDPVPASTGYEGNDRVFTAYLCKLPRTLEIPASNAPVNRGEPAWYRHHLDTSDRDGYPAGWFDPHTWIGAAVPFPWGEDGPWGCVTPDKVALQTAYGEDCGTLEPGMAFCASEATAAIASTGSSDWVYVPANQGDPVLGPPHLRLRFRTWIEPFDDAVVPGWVVPNTDPPQPDDALNANALNVARVFGGTFPISVGSWQSLEQSWPNGVTDPIWIRNRPAVTVVANRLDPEIPIGEFGVIGCYWFGLGGEGQLIGARTTIELPPGFRLARADEPDETPVFTDLPHNRPWAFEDGAVAFFGDHCAPDVDIFLTKDDAAPSVATLDAGTPNERLAVTFDLSDIPEQPVEHCGYGGGGGLDLPFRVAIEPIPGFPFVQDEPNVFTCTVAAPNLTDVFNQPRTVSAQSSVLVPMARLMKLDLEPVCDASGPAPAFDLRYQNAGGQDIAGAYAIFAVPQTTLDEDPNDGAGPLALSFASATLLTHTSLASLFYTTGDPATATDWQPMPAPDPASVRGIKVDFGANELAAWDTTGRIRIVLAPSASATTDHVGQWIRASGFLGSTDLPRVPSLLSEVLFLGECPARLMVVKYLDRNGDGARDAEPTLEPMLAGFDFTLDVTVDSPLASSDTRPNPPFDPAPPPLFIDASDGRTATSSASVAMSFEVWPGQTIEVRETPPGTVVLVAGDEVPGVDWGAPASAYGQPDTITWAATTPIARTHAQLFETDTTLEFGNRCTACTSDDLCMSGQCTEDGTCAFESTDLTCAQTDNLCFADAGACDPASGQCLYQQTECLPDEPTRVYILLEDTSQPGAPVLAGAAICQYDETASPPTLVCATDPATGELVVDASLTCEPAGPNPNE